ncbi:MAG: UbiA family prenyltransferase [Deltaproteobacteria bacterium]|nr:UbiA family prenyltransferase [Deltaproteobacteria bacterium]MBK8237791.1 UbiA family prenyltransferase [Deltaproteobacteria bacterium]MBK8720160.1 UbiA family prenyltransferase [Deltaproteobacteria bacterium]MBP7289732.1 putative 4-hydroxybenzoate polyprenyltransferase [Nannocystaceae bacterium]
MSEAVASARPGTLRAFGSLVKLSHTVFGLPFALASTLLAHRFATAHGGLGLDALRVLWIVLAFTGARAAAMGFNRIVDRRFDAANPRTATRELPAGVMSLRAAWSLTLLSAAVFVGASAALGWLPALLSPACLVVLLGYSYFKRFSWSSHLVLGLALALAPGGAWIAVTGGFAGATAPLLLMLAVATWVAGFDVLYALQDQDFDRAAGLHSIPARFGTVGALVISAALHVVTLLALALLHLHAGLGLAHAAGLLVIAVILVAEHVIVRPGDLSRIGKAFFDLNGWVSLGYLAAVAIDLALA